MKIIYSCYYGCYLSVAAAHLHLGSVNSASDILSLPGFGDINYEKLGELTYHGEDGEGRRIYTIAIKGSGGIVNRAFTGFTQVYLLEPFELIDMNKHNNIYISLGVFISRKISRKLGHMIIEWGIKKDFETIVKYVGRIDDSGRNK